MPHEARFSLLVVLVSVAFGCSQSPTEPSMPSGWGTLIITTTCTVVGTVELNIDSANVGPIAAPGETRFRLSAGRRSHGFYYRGALIMPCGPGAGGGQPPQPPSSGCSLEIPDGGTLRLTEPPLLCSLSSMHP